MGPDRFYRIQNRGGGRQKEQAALIGLYHLGDLPADVCTVVIRHEHCASKVVSFRQRLDEIGHCICIGCALDLAEQSTVAKCTDNCNVALVAP